MSARIAPEPIQTNVAGTSARPSLFDSLSKPAQQPDPVPPSPEIESKSGSGLAPLPAPPPPPGSVFAVALLSGQLSPKPTSEREILQRLGSAKLPAQGSLALRDLVV
jgi:hypothetical protein